MDVRVVDHGGETCIMFSGGFERQVVFYGCVEELKELMNSCVGEFGEETSEREEVNSGLVELIGDMGWVNVWDKAGFIGKWEGVQVSVWEAM